MPIWLVFKKKNCSLFTMLTDPRCYSSSDTLDTLREIRAPHGAFLVLQLHDELVYETSEDVLPQVASLVKSTMEGAVEMAVVMPVKLKVGPSWGELQDWDMTSSS